jgi:tetratricopeptide (TPR) repeat protein
MAVDQTKEGSDWKKKESFGSAILQIALVASVLGGAVFFFYQRGTVKKEVGEKMTAARLVAIRNNPADIYAALKHADEILAIDAASADGLSFAAALHTELWTVHRVPGEEAKAKDFLAKAEKADDRNREDRHASKALLMISEGKINEAEAYIEDLRKRGGASPRLFFAQALALQAQGNLKLARSGFISAADKAWKDPSFTTGFGEANLAEGLYPQAADAFNKALAANPEHLRARLGAALTKTLRRVSVKDAQDLVNELASADLTPALKARRATVAAELAIVEARYDDAIKAADEGIAADPTDAWAEFSKARALGMKKDPAAAAAFDKVLTKNKVAPLFYFDGASLLQQAGSLDASLALLDKYETQFKNVKFTDSTGKEETYLGRDDRYWLARGDVMLAANKPDDAMAAYDKAIAAKSINQVRANYSKAALLVSRKEYDKAAELLVDITPPDGTGVLAEAYVAMGEIQFAKTDYAPGCQSFAFALTRMKMMQAPREQLNALLEDVSKKLIAAKQKEIAKAWKEEATKLIQ